VRQNNREHHTPINEIRTTMQPLIMRKRFAHRNRQAELQEFTADGRRHSIDVALIRNPAGSKPVKFLLTTRTKFFIAEKQVVNYEHRFWMTPEKINHRQNLIWAPPIILIA